MVLRVHELREKGAASGDRAREAVVLRLLVIAAILDRSGCLGAFGNAHERE
jgi:hypothetical protein